MECTNEHAGAYTGEYALECFIGWCLDTASERRRDHVRVWTLARIAQTCSRMRALCLRVIDRRRAVLTRRYGPRLLCAWWNRHMHGPAAIGRTRIVQCRASMCSVDVGDTLGTPVWDPIQPIGSICATSRVIIECADGSPFSLICLGANNVVYDVVPTRAYGRWIATCVTPWFPVPPGGRARICEDPDTNAAVRVGSIRIAIGLVPMHAGTINRVLHMYACMHDVAYRTHLEYAYNTAATTFVNYLHMVGRYRMPVSCARFRDRYLLAMMTARVGMQSQGRVRIGEAGAMRDLAYVHRLTALQNAVANHAPVCAVCRGDDIADDEDAPAGDADTELVPANDVDTPIDDADT